MAPFSHTGWLNPVGPEAGSRYKHLPCLSLPSHLADDPEVQVLHSIGYSAAPRLFPLVWAVLLLPLLLLQTQ